MCMLSAEVWAFKNHFLVLAWRKKTLCTMDVILFKTETKKVTFRKCPDTCRQDHRPSYMRMAALSDKGGKKLVIYHNRSETKTRGKKTKSHLTTREAVIKLELGWLASLWRGPGGLDSLSFR